MDDAKTIYGVIPDVWFDWYARLLPGLFGVALYFYLSGRDIFALSATNLAVVTLCAYVIGTIVAPPSTMISKFVDSKLGCDEIYAEEKRKAKSENDRIPLRNISKVHSEAVCMLSCSFFVLINLVLFFQSDKSNKAYMALGALYFLVFFVERSFARRRKIKDLVP